MPAILQGTLAARPASATTGDLYFGIDTEKWYRWDGGSWITQVNPPVGRDALPPNHGHAAGDIVGFDAAVTAAKLSVVTKVALYNVTDFDNIVLCDASGGGFTINLPTAAGRTGREYEIKKIDASANAVTVDPAGAETIDDAATVPLDVQDSALLVVSDGTNWRIV